VAGVHLRDDREVVPLGALQDHLVELLALLWGVAVRMTEGEAPYPPERAHVRVVYEDAVHHPEGFTSPIGFGEHTAFSTCRSI